MVTESFMLLVSEDLYIIKKRKKAEERGWREDLVLKSVFFLYGGLWFHSRHSHGLWPSVIAVDYKLEA